MPLKIAVLVKQVPDMNAVKVDKATRAPNLSGQQVASSYDLYAVEQALTLQEQHGGETGAIAVGPASVKEALNRALARGIDRAVLVETADPNAVDTLALAGVIAQQVGAISPDIVLAGQTADDYESGQVGAQVAELLNLPLVSNIAALEVDGSTLRLKRDMEDGYQSVEVQTPAVLLSSTGLEEPRLPSLKGIMAAKKKTVDVVSASPEAGRVTWSAPLAPEKGSAGIIVQDVPAAEAAQRLVEWLQSEKLL